MEGYGRPERLFNKALYLEKGGPFPMLIEAAWPERHDCALLTSQGYATRAVRDLLDYLGETDEDLTVFCVHDADGPGTMIYQSLCEATRARPERSIEVVNLGLDPDEALEMGLAEEPVDREGGKTVPVADYIDGHWRKWLQTNRVELNAMSTPEFLEWLDEKIEPYTGKLIPPNEVLRCHFEQTVRSGLRRQLVDKAIRDARVDEETEVAFTKIKPRIDEMNGELADTVNDDLAVAQEKRWTEPVERVAGEIVTEEAPA